MEQFFSIVRKNALKMRRMRKLVNYADPHHRILSDALLLTESEVVIAGIKSQTKALMVQVNIINKTARGLRFPCNDQMDEVNKVLFIWPVLPYS